MKLFSDEKVVIITGASSGIGQDTAVKFVEKGITKLCLNGRNADGLEKTKQDCLAVNKDAEVLLVQGVQTFEVQKIVSMVVFVINHFNVQVVYSSKSI